MNWKSRLDPVLLWAPTFIALLYPVWILVFGPEPGTVFSLVAVGLAIYQYLAGAWPAEDRRLTREVLAQKRNKVLIFTGLGLLLPLWVLLFGPLLGFLYAATMLVIGGVIQPATRCHQCRKIVWGTMHFSKWRVRPRSVFQQIPRECAWCGEVFK